MTQVFYRGISLHQVVLSAERILLVKRVEPYINLEKVPIHEDTEKYPPFTRIRYRFQVTGKLREPSGDSLVGKTVLVLPWTDGMDFGGHKSYYLDGIGESPIIDRYETKANLEKDPEFILFISIIENGEVYFRAYDSMDNIEAVREDIRNPKDPDGPVAVRADRKPQG
jgi:hypothetical protein